MKIPGIFGKTPKHQRFNYKPRYYDPKEEENRDREERIRQEIARENGTAVENTSSDDTLGYRSRMKGSFQSARKRSAPSKDEPNYAIIRLGILLLLALLIVGFFQWGGKVLYILFLVFPVWIYFKFVKKN
ncbi:MAG TPA: hypothetical protein VFE50_19095 [Cyclobacteriaceae bacterium]|nr:hypothetical protein [Cyclobacteriaceae bacterium]